MINFRRYGEEERYQGKSSETEGDVVKIPPIVGATCARESQDHHHRAHYGSGTVLVVGASGQCRWD